VGPHGTADETDLLTEYETDVDFRMWSAGVADDDDLARVQGDLEGLAEAYAGAIEAISQIV
jgi:hypothetical protein